MFQSKKPLLNKLWKLIGVFTLLGLALMLLLSLTITTQAGTIDVAAGNSIQAAISSANPGDTIRVQAGIFTESLLITQSVTLLGGFDAGFINRTPRTTLISPTQRAISVTGIALNVTIDGFEIANATTTGDGAGIYVIAEDDSRILINDNHIHNNQAAYGGGIYITLDNRTHLEITNNNIASNSATNDYGGFYAFNTLSNTVILRNNLIISNTADQNSGGFNLTLHAFGQFQIEDNQIMYNMAPNDGNGGFYFKAEKNVTGTFDRNQIKYNQGDSAGGGHIWLQENVTTTFNDNMIHGNTAANSTGGLYLQVNENVQVAGNRLTITDNMADGDQGGLHVKLERGSALTMTHGITLANNKTVNGNFGGAKFVFDSVNRLYAPNMVIYNNQAENGSWGGVAWYASAQGLETIIVPNAQVISNTAFSDYGGAYLDLEHHSLADLTGSRFERNQAKGGIAGGLKVDDIAEGSILLLNNSQFLTNTSAKHGGGANIETPEKGGFLQLIGVSFISNTATWQGGGLYMGGNDHGGLADQEAFVISGTLFERNISGGNGGGYYLSRCLNGCRYRIDHNRFIHNRSGDQGGGFHSGEELADEGSWASFSYNEVLSNTANSDGGGIYINRGLANTGSYATFNFNLIAHNQANGAGGGAYLRSVQDGSYAQVMSNTVIYNFSSSLTGGGLDFLNVDEGSTLEIRHNRIMSNSIIGYGGGMRIDRVNDGGTLWMTDNQIEHNSATDTGGGVAFDNGVEEARAYIERNSIQYNQALHGGGCHNSSSYFADDGSWILFKDNQIKYNRAIENFAGCHFADIHEGAFVTFQDNAFNHNNAGGDYGGLYMEGSKDGATIIFEHNQIVGNQAGISGTTVTGGNYGGVTFDLIRDGATVHVRHNIIERNIAHYTNDIGGDYGGLYAYLLGTNSFDRPSSFTDHNSGDLYTNTPALIGSFNLVDNTIVQNTAHHSFGGVTIDQEGGSRLIMTRNLITANTAITQYGGVTIWAGPDADDSQYYLNWNEITDNQARWNGGLSIINDDLAEPLWGHSRNNLIADNTDTGIYIKNANFQSINDTIANNGSVGVAMGGTLEATAQLANGIIWGHSTTAFSTTTPTSHTLQASYSSIQGGVLAGPGNISSDPLFVDASRGNYRLQAGSPAIDQADNTLVPSQDLERVPRPVNGTVDMGAYEYHLPGVMVVANSSLAGDPGTTINHTLTISNTGNAEDIFTISLGGSNWDSTLSTTSQTIPANSSTTLNLAVTVPTDADAGDNDSLTVYATSQRNAQIVDAATIETTANQVAAVSITPDRQATGQAHSILRYQHQVTNLGNGNDTFNLSANSSAGWSVQVMPPSVTLAANGTTTVTVQILIPAGLNNVTDQTSVRATSAHNSNVNVAATDTTTAINLVDLSLGPNNTTTALVNTVQVYTHTLTNNASEADTVNLNATSDQGWVVTVNPANITLNPTDSTNVVVNVTVPSGANGLVDITTLQATSGNNGESVVAVDVTTLLNPASLRVSPGQVGSALAGTLAAYTYIITNNGARIDTLALNAISDQGWVTEIDLVSRRSATPQARTARAAQAEVTLMPGESATVSVQVNIPTTASGGQTDHTRLYVVSAYGQAAQATNTSVTTVLGNQALNLIYLPTIAKNRQGIPDLVVQDVIVTADGVQVVIHNQGDGAVKDAFWVDLYLNPNPIPAQVNDMWYDGRSNAGIVWGLVGSQLAPLTPGGNVTLTVGDASYNSDLTSFSGFTPGDQIYVQVDSVNADTDYGAVLENHEINGQPYNNIAGPFVVTSLTHSGGIQADQAEITTFQNNALPARPRLIR